MLLVMLFTPLFYPAQRLPSILVDLDNWLPFIPMHRLLTDAAFPGMNMTQPPDVFICSAWFTVCTIACLAGLSRRR